MRVFNCCILLTLVVGAYCFAQGGASKEAESTAPLAKNNRYPYPQFIIRGGDEDSHLLAIFDLTRKANGGNAIAQYELGLYYLLGIGTVPDTVKAAYWTKKAADQHHAVAEFNMSVFYTNGWGVPWNPFNAYKNIRAAAEAGLIEAEYYTSRFLLEDLVVPRNIPEAYRWVKLSADSGFVPAKEVLKEFIKRGWIRPDELADSSEESVAEDENASTAKSGGFQPVFLDFSHDTVASVDRQTLVKEALAGSDPALRAKADSAESAKDTIAVDPAIRKGVIASAEAGSPEALVLVGKWFETGEGAKRDLIQAAANYIRAMRLDSPRAPRLLWEIIRDGKFFSLLKSRVESHDPVAEFVWSELITLGFDHQLTDEQARKMLESAVRSGYEPAINEAAMACFVGSGVKKDKEKAMKLWQRAADNGNMEAKIRSLIASVVGVPDATIDSDALNFLNDADRKGAVLAQALLGYCYEIGLGVRLGKTQAAYYYRLAAQRGNQIAFNGLKRMYDEIRPKEKEFQLSD